VTLATPLNRRSKPLRPINCPVCDKLIGSFYRDGLSLRAFAGPCTPRCMTLWKYGHGKPFWWDLPIELRALYLVGGLLDQTAR
jgi:hypothetical protein